MTEKILLVHADKDLRDSVRVILNSSGYLVFEAADCENALSLLANETFDLILLNITLPDKSSFRVLDFLNENHLNSKVIVITGTAGLEHTIKSTSLGAREYITKPYDPNYLLKSIDHVLSGRSQTNHKLHIINAGDFIKSTPTGDLDLEGSTRGLAEIAAAGTTLQDYTVLIDLRDIKSQLSTNDIYKLAFELVKYGETFQRKTAVLVRPDKDIGQAVLFETAAQDRGFRVRAFTVFEDAINWLSSITQLTESPIV